MAEKQRITVWEEHMFWLEILQDHAIFVRDYLSPEEKRWVQMAEQYIQAFGRLREILFQLDPTLPAESDTMKRFAAEVYPVACGYYQLEGHLQGLRIQNEVNLNLTPTYLNGTLSENEEYLRLLGFYMKGQQPEEMSLVSLLDMWLMDQVGHAYLLANSLDPVESELGQRAREFVQRFQAFVATNNAMRGYLRFLAPGFPRQERFAREVLLAVMEFNKLIVEVVNRYKEDEVFTRLTLRFLEHHFPEACYLMRKLSAFVPEMQAEISCPLTKPSFVTKA
ncbi:DUF2935 domain-containing protein [Brevibacillus dissolubilis]|uniref:DUF2935 domain-containing protein n=1 Tax=Brevibacillus dissolubilis TaxID=1844116 RepID=UPI00111783EF|nr:DUF2935 domain-containing protein [Brevibacillus dissolubilis]